MLCNTYESSNCPRTKSKLLSSFSEAGVDVINLIYNKLRTLSRVPSPEYRLYGEYLAESTKYR